MSLFLQYIAGKDKRDERSGNFHCFTLPSLRNSLILNILAMGLKSSKELHGVKLKGRTRPVTQTSTKATAATENVDMVRYTSESVQISPNAAYESVTFSDEPIYDQPM